MTTQPEPQQPIDDDRIAVDELSLLRSQVGGMRRRLEQEIERADMLDAGVTVLRERLRERNAELAAAQAAIGDRDTEIEALRARIDAEDTKAEPH